MDDADVIKKLTESYESVDKVFSDFDSLMKIMIHINFGEKLAGLYSLIDDDSKFSKMIDFFNGVSIEMPTLEEFKSTITLTLIYYYKELMGYSWKKIQELIPYENDVSLRYGGKLKNVNKIIKRRINKEYKNNSDSMFE